MKAETTPPNADVKAEEKSAAKKYIDTKSQLTTPGEFIHGQVFFPISYQELFTSWNRFPESIVYAGGTDLIRYKEKRAPSMSRNIICLDMIEELKRITRTEKYLEIGAMVRLNDIINMGKIIPDVLTKTLEGIANPAVRNLATIGGNLCHWSYRMDASAPMIVLDAHYELKSASSARWISAAKFSGLPGKLGIKPQEILTRIRIPLDQWNYSVYRKFKPLGSDESGGVIVFALKSQKRILTDIRMVYARSIVFQDRNSEAFLIGKELPLSRKDAGIFVDKWKQYLISVAETAAAYKHHFEKYSFDQIAAQIMAFAENVIDEITE